LRRSAFCRPSAVEAVNRAGIPLAEVTMTVPNALEVIHEMSQSLPEMVIWRRNRTGCGNGAPLAGRRRTVFDQPRIRARSAGVRGEERHSSLPWRPDPNRGDRRVGDRLISQEALYTRKQAPISELARRYLNMVRDARAQKESA